MVAKSKYFDAINNERSVASFIPFTNHISSNTLVTKDGDLLRIWKLKGMSFETVDAQDIHIQKDRLNTLFRAIGSNQVALWCHNIRRQTSDRLISNFDNPFCRDFDQKYFDSFKGYRMMATELYLTVIYRPNPTRFDKAWIKSMRRSLEDIKRDQEKALHKFDEIAY